MTAIVVFGEIVPQAVCTGPTRLAIGAFWAPFVRVQIVLFYVIAKPIAMVMDRVLGEDHADMYRQSELKALIGLHVRDEIKRTLTARDDAHSAAASGAAPGALSTDGAAGASGAAVAAAAAAGGGGGGGVDAPLSSHQARIITGAIDMSDRGAAALALARAGARARARACAVCCACVCLALTPALVACSGPGRHAAVGLRLQA